MNNKYIVATCISLLSLFTCFLASAESWYEQCYFSNLEDGIKSFEANQICLHELKILKQEKLRRQSEEKAEKLAERKDKLEVEKSLTKIAKDHNMTIEQYLAEESRKMKEIQEIYEAVHQFDNDNRKFTPSWLIKTENKIEDIKSRY